MDKYELDLLGEVCPVPLLKAQEKLAVMNSGDILIVHTDFTRSVRNIMNLCLKHDYPIDVKEVSSGVWELTVTKG
ncbi:sulfurtransferase TusA family protein [Desulfuribacillus alkaliarsenatis]|uniref:UPF0033 domain-containing protein n=1 Tax=Desulfuribacillus alkaliarsenatis TaxID=766136 RepID=A0A1E5G3L0_9FIRM|nr:sulfurtransferase TusA family protein [Desulfuribacillus alkaliarsenatis]OEF97674.1 hypothetical protein BHF68_14325 [Desulfuribacillus alkaliarsenatis]